MTKRELVFCGGELWCPDSACIIEESAEIPRVEYALVHFRSECFNEDGSWKDDVIDELERMVQFARDDQKLRSTHFTNEDSTNA